MAPKCRIVFENNPAKVFYGGQQLAGRVELTLTEEVTVRSNFLKHK